MGCTVESNNAEGLVKNKNGKLVGLLYSHCYTIFDVFEIKDFEDENKTHKLLRIRNPWGDVEWNGKWSDDSIEFLNHGKM